MTFTLADARLRTRQYCPYLISHLLSLIPIPKPGMGTMGVDAYGRLYYDPALFDKWTLDEVCAVLIHEDLHVVLRHHMRCRRFLGDSPSDVDLKIWNIAADCAINQTLVDAGVPLPDQDECCLPEKFGLEKNLTTEAYFEMLRDKAGADKNDPGEGGHPGGSGADGHKREWEDGPPPNKDGEAGDNGNPEGLSEHEQEQLSRQVAKECDDHQKRQGRGSLPGSLARMANRIMRPKTDPVREWTAMVRYSLHCVSGHGDYTWQKLNRRQPTGSYRLPAHIQPTPRMCFILDSSGSMGDSDFALGFGVIEQGCKAIPNANIHVITGDTRRGSVQNVFRPEQVSIVGGGGTDMTPLIIEAAAEKPRPDIIFVLTDGYTPWPSEPVGCKVVACITRNESGEGIPDWIPSVELRPEGMEDY